MFLSTFDAFRHHFEPLQFWSKSQIFFDFSDEKRLKDMGLAALFKRKIGGKNEYKLFKIFIFEKYREIRCVLHT